MDEKTALTVGYDRKGAPRMFNLKPGEKLPEGWADRPPPGTHPAEVADGIKAEPEPPAPQKKGAA